jgi:hypothetical protein
MPVNIAYFKYANKLLTDMHVILAHVCCASANNASKYLLKVDQVSSPSLQESSPNESYFSYCQ